MGKFQHIVPDQNEKGAFVLYDGDMTLQFLESPLPDTFKLVQTYRAKVPNTNKGPKSKVAPPYHIHLNQTPDQEEQFEVKQGKTIYKLDGRTGTLEPGQHVTFKTGSSHTIYPAPDTPEDVIVEGVIPTKKDAAAVRGLTAEFLFNLNCYLNSCHAAHTSPSKFQLAVFLDRGDLALAGVPGSKWLINVVMGRWIGKRMLGMKDDYYDAAFKKAFSP